MIKVIKFKVRKHRNPYRKPVVEAEPIPRSRYAQSLWDEGAGWKDEQEADRTDTERL